MNLKKKITYNSFQNLSIELSPQGWGENTYKERQVTNHIRSHPWGGSHVPRGRGGGRSRWRPRRTTRSAGRPPCGAGRSGSRAPSPGSRSLRRAAAGCWGAGTGVVVRGPFPRLGVRARRLGDRKARGTSGDPKTVIKAIYSSPCLPHHRGKLVAARTEGGNMTEGQSDGIQYQRPIRWVQGVGPNRGVKGTEWKLPRQLK